MLLKLCDFIAFSYCHNPLLGHLWWYSVRPSSIWRTSTTIISFAWWQERYLSKQTLNHQLQNMINMANCKMTIGKKYVVVKQFNTQCIQLLERDEYWLTPRHLQTLKSLTKLTEQINCWVGFLFCLRFNSTKPWRSEHGGDFHKSATDVSRNWTPCQNYTMVISARC